MYNYYFRNTCRMGILIKALELTPTPPENDFLSKKKLENKK